MVTLVCPGFSEVSDSKKSPFPSPQQDSPVRATRLSSGELGSQDGTRTAIAAKSGSSGAVSDDLSDNTTYKGFVIDREMPAQERNSDGPSSVVVITESERPNSERPTGLGKKVDLKGEQKAMSPAAAMVVGLGTPVNVSEGPVASHVAVSEKQFAAIISQFVKNGTAVINLNGSPVVAIPQALPWTSLVNVTNMASFYGAIGMFFGKESGTSLNGSAGGQTALYVSKRDVPEVDPATRDEGSSNHGGSGNSGSNQNQQEERQNS